MLRKISAVLAFNFLAVGCATSRSPSWEERMYNVNVQRSSARYAMVAGVTSAIGGGVLIAASRNSDMQAAGAVVAGLGVVTAIIGGVQLGNANSAEDALHAERTAQISQALQNRRVGMTGDGAEIWKARNQCYDRSTGKPVACPAPSRIQRTPYGECFDMKSGEGVECPKEEATKVMCFDADNNPIKCPEPRAVPVREVFVPKD